MDPYGYLSLKNFEGKSEPIPNLFDYYYREETLDQQVAFDKLKKRLTTALVLVYPDFSKSFILFTNAFDTALGAILLPKDEINKK
ncbi:6803_t:CDS:2, partial [Gigaspora margarita]